MKTKIEVFREKIRKLVEQFERDKHFYLSKQYLEAQARHDFINPFFEALGWDIGNRAGLSPFEREVLLEKGETKGRPDYNFRIGGASKFYVEAKAPSEPLDKTAHIMQAKLYAWNTKDVFIVVLTDFEEFKVFDATLKPDPRNPNLGLIYDFKYTDYLEKLDKLWVLSRDEVASDSLDKLLLKDAQSKRLRIPVDKSFLSDMTGWREELAKDLYKRNPDINVRMLNEVVQRILDRFVFIRIAEDRKVIEPKSLLELVELWKSEGKRRPLLYHLNILFRQINGDLNGEIFKHHACETYEFDSSLLAKIIEGLYFPKCPYRFDVIGVELLGSIYERYLGNTIRLTAKRVKVEEKPEVRKAGGVYYTPKYIVDYIVDNTVGKLIEGKTPEQIAEIKILDPACGSGSFLLGAYQKLIDYHIKYYTEHPAEAGRSTLFPDLIIDPDGSHRLSITKKAEILQNNIFGVDIDPQAVEVSMMSLYIKALEGERTLPQNKELLPSLADNIKCGNSLIGYDLFEQKTLIEDEERERINPFDWNSKKAGFGDIMEKGGFDCVVGNPPWVDIKGMDPDLVDYYFRRYSTTQNRMNIYATFIQKSLEILSKSGMFGFITPSSYLTQSSYTKLRKLILENTWIQKLVRLPDNVFTNVKAETAIVILEKNGTGRTSILLYNRAGAISEISKQTCASEKMFSQKNWLNSPGFIFNIFITENIEQLLRKIESASLPLQQFCDFSLGLTPYDKYKGHTQQQIKNRVFHSDYKKDETFKPLLSGADVSRYGINWESGEWISYGNWLGAPREQRFFTHPRIIVRQIISGEPPRIFAGYTEQEFYNAQIGFNLLLKREVNISLKFLLALINSRLMTFYHRNRFLDQSKRVFQKILIQDAKNFPIRTIDFNNPKDKEVHDKLVALVDRMLELNSKKNVLPPSSERERIEREIAVTDEKIDEIVYGLYGLTEVEVEEVEESFK